MDGSGNDELVRRLGVELALLRKVHRPPPASHRERPAAPAHSASKRLTDLERRALFVALSAGTEQRLGRMPTVDEFVRLVDAVAVVRQIAEMEQGLLYGDLKIHWSGQEWVFDRNEPEASSEPRHLV